MHHWSYFICFARDKRKESGLISCKSLFMPVLYKHTFHIPCTGTPSFIIGSGGNKKRSRGKQNRRDRGLIYSCSCIKYRSTGTCCTTTLRFHISREHMIIGYGAQSSIFEQYDHGQNNSSNQREAALFAQKITFKNLKRRVVAFDGVCILYISGVPIILASSDCATA